MSTSTISNFKIVSILAKDDIDDFDDCSSENLNDNIDRLSINSEDPEWFEDFPIQKHIVIPDTTHHDIVSPDTTQECVSEKDVVILDTIEKDIVIPDATQECISEKDVIVPSTSEKDIVIPNATQECIIEKNVVVSLIEDDLSESKMDIQPQNLKPKTHKEIRIEFFRKSISAKNCRNAFRSHPHSSIKEMWLHKMISESLLLIDMTIINPDIFKDITLEKLNEMFDNTRFKDCIKRVYPIYQGRYPKTILRTIEDLYYLRSSKMIDMLVLMHHSSYKDDIISKLNPNIIIEYEKIKQKEKELPTSIRFMFCENNKLEIVLIISLELVDLFKSKMTYLNLKRTNKYHLADIEKVFEIACMYNNLEIIEFIWPDLIEHFHFNKIYNMDQYKMKLYTNACENGNVEVLKWIWDHVLKKDIRVIDEIIKNTSRSSKHFNLFYNPSGNLIFDGFRLE